jgi:hypothetical protein
MATSERLASVAARTGVLLLVVAAASSCGSPVTQSCSDLDTLSRSNGKPGDVIVVYGTVNPQHTFLITIGDVFVEGDATPVPGLVFVVPVLPPNVYRLIIEEVECPGSPALGPIDFAVDAP